MSDDLILRGSETAKGGFRNETDVINKFNNWREDKDAKEWLKIMGYKLEEVEKVEAEKVRGRYKADVQAKVKIFLKNLVDVQNLSVKLVSNMRGYNQVDKRWVDDYKNLWDMPDDIVIILKKFCGEISPDNPKTVRDRRRMFLNEMTKEEQQKVINFFKQNKTMVICDILKGRGRFSAEWMLVARKVQDDVAIDTTWVLKPINFVINYYSEGEVKISERGSLHIGRITMQRKGGDGGRKTANMLQFKMNPAELFEVK